jgi:anti-sigma regulatory factor (Ser/Thr protein kinase)
MHTMNAVRSTAQRPLHLSLDSGPAAARQARNRIEALLRAWQIPVDADVAVLLTSELVSNAVVHGAGGPVTLTVSCVSDHLRVAVHDTSRTAPVLVETSPDAEAGRGLMLVATLASDWGSYRTRTGKVVYFMLAFAAGV